MCVLLRRDPARCLHAGLSLFPSTPVSVPLWTNEAGMGRMLHTLRTHSIPKAERDATVVIRPGLETHEQVVNVLRVWAGAPPRRAFKDVCLRR